MSRPAAAAIVELYEWSRAARDLFVRSHQPHDSPGMRALKSYLAERHTTHLRELRQLLHELGQSPSLAAQSHQQTTARFGHDTERALQSAARAVTIAACGVVEQQLAQAYDQVRREPDQLAAPARALTDRHATELESLRSFVRQIQAEQPVPHQAARERLMT